MPDSVSPIPRLTYLRIKNYRALRDVEFRDLTPLTVLIGPNGSGKSTVLDALDFLAEAVRGNMQAAWEKRDRFRGMRTRGSEENIEFEVVASLSDSTITYKISLTEKDGAVEVENEELIEGSNNKRVFYRKGKTYNRNNSPIDYYTDFNPNWGSLQEKDDVYLTFASVFPSEYADSKDKSLVDFLRLYRLLHLTDDHLKGYSDAGPREKLSPNGDNLPNVLYYLHERHPETLVKITAQLRRWVPQLADVVPEITSDERLLLRFKDGPFEKPLPAPYMSGGTMRLAALLTLLYEPNATGLLGIEEPENELHPQLLPRLAEELITVSETRQLLVATHSPALLNALAPEQVWILHRGPDGYTQATRTADLPGIPAMVEEGSPLGYLWARNFFDVGNPLDSPLASK